VSPATPEQAAAAKEKLAMMLEDLPELSALGVAILDGGFGLKVNLVRRSDRPIPTEIDGVPVIIEVVGEALCVNIE
jgi:hypothetical protein